jgi:hypothetical protein
MLFTLFVRYKAFVLCYRQPGEGQTSNSLATYMLMGYTCWIPSETVIYQSSLSCDQEARMYGTCLQELRVTARHGAVVIPTHTTDGENHQPVIKKTWREVTMTSTLHC